MMFKKSLTVTLSFMRRKSGERSSQIAHSEFRDKIIIGLAEGVLVCQPAHPVLCSKHVHFHSLIQPLIICLLL